MSSFHPRCFLMFFYYSPKDRACQAHPYQEQGENVGKIKLLKNELKKAGGQQVTTDLFLETIRRYTGAQELTQRMVTELIDHIDVYHAEKDGDGLTTQQVVIHYNCIGVFAVPERKNMLKVDVRMETRTRKGVAVCYSPVRIA